MGKYASLCGFILIGWISTGCDQNAQQNKAHSGYTLNAKEVRLIEVLFQQEVALFLAGKQSPVFSKIVFAPAVAVARAYATDEKAATQKFAEKSLLINGTIERIDRVFGNAPYLALQGYSPERLPQIHFYKIQPKKIATLQAGQAVQFVCAESSVVAGTPIFKKCVFAEAYISYKEQIVKNSIQKLLQQKKSDQEDAALADLALRAIAAARTLADSSSCFTDQSSCARELAALDLRAASAQVTKELAALGVELPKAKVGKEN